MFLSACSTGILSIVLLSNFSSPSVAEKLNKTSGWLTTEFNRGLPAVILGTALVGIGMPLGGSCPVGSVLCKWCYLSRITKPNHDCRVPYSHRLEQDLQSLDWYRTCLVTVVFSSLIGWVCGRCLLVPFWVRCCLVSWKVLYLPLSLSRSLF